VITINSEPPDHSSALFGITKWGGNIVRTLADGITSELGLANRTAHALADALAPNLRAPEFAMAGGGRSRVGAGPGDPVAGTTNVYQLHVKGKEIEVQSERDLARMWRTLEGYDQ
jgi:hypothetical protein